MYMSLFIWSKVKCLLAKERIGRVQKEYKNKITVLMIVMTAKVLHSYNTLCMTNYFWVKLYQKKKAGFMAGCRGGSHSEEVCRPWRTKLSGQCQIYLVLFEWKFNSNFNQQTWWIIVTSLLRKGMRWLCFRQNKNGSNCDEIIRMMIAVQNPWKCAKM